MPIEQIDLCIGNGTTDGSCLRHSGLWLCSRDGTRPTGDIDRRFCRSIPLCQTGMVLLQEVAGQARPPCFSTAEEMTQLFRLTKVWLREPDPQERWYDMCHRDCLLDEPPY